MADTLSVGYLKDGVYYSGAGFGGELVTAVHGVPVAEREARAYRNWTTASVVLDALAIVGMGVGTAVNHTVDRSEDARRNTDVVIFGAGIGLLFVGLGLQGIARPHAYNAANAYNDAVESPTPPPVSPTTH